MKIRPAVNDDFNAIMKIATATSSADSLWNLLLPRAAFKDEAFKDFVSQLLKFYLDPNNTDWLVTVVELPEKDITPGAPSVASFAIWDMTNAGTNTAAKSSNGEGPSWTIQDDEWPGELISPRTCQPASW